MTDATAALPDPWTDQAREIARLLLAELSAELRTPELWRRIATDPALFWLRGEMQPPGEWHGPDGGTAGDSALLDLMWLAKAGYEVTVGYRDPGYRVSLSPSPDGWTALTGQGETPGEALAKAREWAERRLA